MKYLGESSSDSRQFDGNRLALFNSAGYLEIAIYRSNLKTVGGATTLLGLEYRDTNNHRVFIAMCWRAIVKIEFS